MTRVTVTLPAELVEEIDRLEKNRSSFVVEGIRREVERRRREGLRRSLAAPHAEAAELAEEGTSAWLAGLPDEAHTDLVDVDAGEPVAWLPGRGWLSEEE